MTAAASRWTQAAEDADPGAPCRRLNSVYAMHAIQVGAAVQPDGYNDLHELAMPQARLLRLRRAAPHGRGAGAPPPPPAPLQVWRYKQRMQATVGSVVAQLDGEARPTIGFHVRGGDKLIEDRIGCARASWALASERAAAAGCRQRVTRPRRAGTAPPRWRTTTSRRSRRRSGGAPSGAGCARPRRPRRPPAPASPQARHCVLAQNCVREPRARHCRAAQHPMHVLVRVSAPCEARTLRELHRQLRTSLPHAAALSVPSRPARPRPGSGLQTEHRRAAAAPALTAPAARAAQPMADGTCVIVGDDEALLREAEALAVERLGCALFRGREAYEMSSHMQHTFNRLPYDQRCAASLHLLTDMELLAHADFFVGACRAAGCGRGAPAYSSAACLAPRLKFDACSI